MTAPTVEPAGVSEERWQVPLWNAINAYVAACGGDPSKHVYGNTSRMDAMAVANGVVRRQLAELRGRTVPLSEWQQMEQQQMEQQLAAMNTSYDLLCDRLETAEQQLAAMRGLVQRYASECADCGGKGYVYDGEAITGRGPDDVLPNRISCVECEDIRAALAPTSQPSRGKCETCDGRGVVGGHLGQTPENFEYVTEPCPDCAQPSRGKCPTCDGDLIVFTERDGDIPASLTECPDCAQPERQGATPFDQLKAAMQADDAYAWSWHCNIAMPMLDAKQGLTHQQANECAAAVMEHMFRIDVRKSREWQATFQQPEERPSPPQDDIVAGLIKLRREMLDKGVLTNNRADVIDRAIAALGEKRCTRETVIRECWDAINKRIATGPLPTTYQTEQRNGMVLATNMLMELMVRR